MYFLIVENEKDITGATTIKDSAVNKQTIPVSKEVYDNYDIDSSMYIYSEGKIIENPEYENIVAERAKKAQKQLLLEQIDEIDKKRIRAICEPSEKEPGLTWLEYYNSQVSVLREQLKNL